MAHSPACPVEFRARGDTFCGDGDGLGDLELDFSGQSEEETTWRLLS